jgi:hypothetical protein
LPLLPKIMTTLKGSTKWGSIKFMSENKRYAQVTWAVGDITSITDLTDKQAEEWLENNQKHIQNRLVELGWEVITDLLSYDGIEVTQ